MVKITINENTIKRGMNSLFYQVEIRGENYFATIKYPRKIANLLHETSIFKTIKRMEGRKLNKSQCLEYCKKLEKVIKMLEEVEEVY